MQITGAEVIPVNADVTPLGEPDGIAPYESNHDSVEDVDRVLVRLDTDEGVSGWGEMLAALASPEATKAVFESVVIPPLIGRSVWEINALIEEFYFPYVKIEPFIGAVEMAMFDALGKHLDVPVSKLLGGAYDPAVDVAYAVGILPREDSRRHARKAVADGFSVLKTKAGPDWRQDVDRIVAMDEAADGNLEFRLDPNQGWSIDEAIRVGAELGRSGVDVQYLEQPVRIDSVGNYSSLRSRLQIPIAVNEDTYFKHNLMTLVREDAIDVAVVDIIPAGGIVEMRKLAGLAEHAGVSLAHHCGFDLGVKTAAMVHAVAATPAISLAADTVYYGWAEHVIDDPFTVEEGQIEVPDGPGLGVTVDEEKLERCRLD
ncbi:mandelate racemase/muconate lactonizing enzyme family protein [Halorubrum trueperi]|uniref:glucarate dehydratase n=1 Tax=Halorubrum trueperi TaxID=2004704 RepID=A0ABD5UHT5_9EURY